MFHAPKCNCKKNLTYDTAVDLISSFELHGDGKPLQKAWICFSCKMVWLVEIWKQAWKRIVDSLTPTIWLIPMHAMHGNVPQHLKREDGGRGGGRWSLVVSDEFAKNRKLQIYFKWFLSSLGFFGVSPCIIFMSSQCSWNWVRHRRCCFVSKWIHN